MSVGTPGAIQAPPFSAAVLGQGIKYPPTLDTTNGRLALSWGKTTVDDAIRSICLTQRSERVLQTDYGAGTQTFEPIDLHRFKAVLEQNIADHEPRAQNVSVTIQPAPAGEVLSIVAYNVAGEATTRSLTVPLFAPPAVTGPSQ